MNTIPYASYYGCKETNGLVSGAAYHDSKVDHPKTPHVDWTEPGLKIVRLRLLSDPGYPMWDVSYCDGKLDGYHVTVHLPFSTLPKRGYKRSIVEYAKRDKLYAKALGVLDCISTLN